MEKNNYQKPDTKTVKLTSQHMIADSGNESGGDSPNPGGNSREYRSGWKDEE